MSRFLPWGSSPDPKPPTRDLRRDFNDYVQRVPAPVLVAFGGASAVLVTFVHKCVSVVIIPAFLQTYSLHVAARRYFRRLRNSDYISTDVIARKRWIKGVVTSCVCVSPSRRCGAALTHSPSVGDADNFRLYHTPGFGWRWPLKFRRVPTLGKGASSYPPRARRSSPPPLIPPHPDLKDETIHIRIAGVDAPEAAHFGRPAQPYSAEALAWLRGAIEGRTLRCLLLRRDQYARVVGLVELPPRVLPAALFSGKCLSLEMLRAGWATTYEQAGAEYGKGGKDAFLRVEAEARAARRGMWASGTKAETPAEYKRRHAKAEAADAKTGGKTGPAVGAAKPKSRLRRLWPFGK
ncbi:hypothetical protein HWV62_13663 [Athelia sp. TMB]|nr:hypothetical protein HWV62_13663 [Athelia sp. TMB]